MQSLRQLKKEFLIIDYNPETVEQLEQEGYYCTYGDITDGEILNEIDFSKTHMIISTIPDKAANLVLINKVKQKEIIIVVVSHQIDDALELYDAGATYVLMPHFLGGEYASSLIERYGLSVDDFLKEKIKHLEHLRTRKALGHEHPRHERER
jgi:Trk K+ transport system NAD-binding subunit